MSGYAIGVDLGATKLASALVDVDGNVLNQYQSKTPASADALMHEIGLHVHKLGNGVENKILGVGIGSPGWHNHETGLVEGAVNLGDSDFNLRDGLKSQFEFPMFHATDAHAETLGEWLFGAGKGSRDMVYFGVGSGLGSGFIIDEKLFYGTNGVGANMAHFGYGLNGMDCVCGLNGCLETHVGGLAISTLVRKVNESVEQSEKLSETISNQELLENALNGEKVAVAVFEEMGKWLGVALSVAVAMINPDRVVIGGGIGKAAYDLLYDPMVKEAKRRTISIAWRELTIKRSRISSSAVGAACLVWHSF